MDPALISDLIITGITAFMGGFVIGWFAALLKATAIMRDKGILEEYRR